MYLGYLQYLMKYTSLINRTSSLMTRYMPYGHSSYQNIAPFGTRRSAQMLSSKVNSWVYVTSLDRSCTCPMHQISLSHHPLATLLLVFFSFLPFPSLLFSLLLHMSSSVAKEEEYHPLTCPYDNTRHNRQWAKLMGDSKCQSIAASRMAITVKAMAPIRRSSLQSGSKTFRNSPRDAPTPAIQT